MAIPGLGGRGLTAEQILGMSTEEFKTKMESAASKADLDALKTASEQNSTTLSAIQESLRALTAKPLVPDPQVELDQNDPTTQLLSDPNGFIARQNQGIQQTALQARADVQEMRARSANPGAFAKFGKELIEAAKHFPVNARAMDGFWDQHIASFIGNKAMKGEWDGNYPSLLGSSSVAAQGSMGGDVTDPNSGFTPDQVAFFKEQGIPVAKAAAYRDLMERDKEPIDMQRYKERIANAA